MHKLAMLFSSLGIPVLTTGIRIPVLTLGIPVFTSIYLWEVSEY